MPSIVLSTFRFEVARAPRDGTAIGDPKALVGVKPIIVLGIAVDRKIAILEAIGRLTAVEDRLPEYVAALKGARRFIDWEARLPGRDRPFNPFNMG